VLPYANTEAMELHLKEISRTVASGAHCALVIDRAGWHTSAKLKRPRNITLIPLPPYAPELNPTENIWEYLRKNNLALRVFNNYDAIVEACCTAWNDLIAMPHRIASITKRNWANVS
jgi:transposase